MFNKFVVKLITLSLFFYAISFGATTGKISGHVKDAETGQPLLGANVVLVNTGLGASTDEQGFFFVLNVPPGKYTINITMIGYKKAVYEEVRVMADHTTNLNVSLSPTVLKGEEVVVVAQRPLIQKDVTSSLRITAAEDIEQMPVQSYLDILNTSTGIISTGNEENQELHVRGSRSGEVVYLVDGFQVDDIVYRGMATDVNTQAINELSLITGTFNAEYGEAAAAVVNIVTKEGPAFYSGNLRFLTDQVGRIFGERLPSDFNSQRIEGTFGGPVPFLENFSNFFFSGDIYSTDTYLGRIRIPRTIIDFNESEPFIDGNGNQIWDEGEEFTDLNDNGTWDYVVGKALDGTELKKGNYRNTSTFRKENRLVGKLVFKPFKNVKMILGYNRFRQNARGYSHYFKQIPDHNAPYWEYSDLFNATLNHTISPSTSYQLRYSIFNNMYAEGLEEFMNDDFELFKKSYSEPFIDENGNGMYDQGEQFFDSNNNDQYDSQAEWWSYMPEPYYDVNLNGVYDEGEEFIDLSGNHSYNLGLIPPLTVYIPSIGSNYEFAGSYIQYDNNGDTIRWLTSDDDFWQKYTARTTTFGGFITSQINQYHQIKIGFDLEKHQIENHWISGISPNGQDYHSQEAYYKKHPLQADAWIQDKIEFSDMVVQLGLRYDYLEPQGEYLRDPYNPYITTVDPETGEETKVLDLVKAKPKIQISPRIGFGYPVTDKTLFRFSYGKFFQNPGFDRFWRRINESGTTLYNFAQGYIPTFGNPNLKPQSTTAYEVGMEQQIATDIKLSLTMFYKDQYNYATSFIYDVDPIPYAMFVNGDYANSRGIEISFEKRYSNFWSAQINYTYSRAEGNADDEWTHWDEAYQASVYGTFPAKKTITMPWDQPHTLNFVVTYQKPFNYGFTLIGNLGSGLPYTPTDARGRAIDETNSARKPPTVNIDLRTNKDFSFRKFRIRLFADIYNVLNYKNVIWVFSNSGKPNQSTNPNTSLDNEDRPHYYGAPRHIEIGIDFIFDQRGEK